MLSSYFDGGTHRARLQGQRRRADAVLPEVQQPAVAAQVQARLRPMRILHELRRLLLDMTELEELLERFRRGPELMAAVLTGAAGSELDYQPEPGKWNIKQITAHVADTEIVAAVRFRRIIAEENPTLEAFDQNAWADRLDYTKRKSSHSLEMFRRVRLNNYELLRGLPAEAFGRTGNHTERGVVTLLDLVKIFAGHPESHALQIRRVRDAFKAQRSAGA